MEYTTDTLTESPADSNLPKTSWSPLSGTSTNFTSHRLKVDGDVAKFKLAVMLYIFIGIFYGAFFGAGLFVVSFPEIQEQIGHQYILPIRFVLIILAIVAVYVIYKKLSSPVVFSKRNGWFWKGHESPETVSNISELKHACKLDKIVGIQILSKRTRQIDNSRSYTCYELNLILEDSSRLHVFTHGGLNSVVVDAEELGEFLDVPVLQSKDM